MDGQSSVDDWSRQLANTTKVRSEIHEFREENTKIESIFIAKCIAVEAQLCAIRSNVLLISFKQEKCVFSSQCDKMLVWDESNVKKCCGHMKLTWLIAALCFSSVWIIFFRIQSTTISVQWLPYANNPFSFLENNINITIRLSKNSFPFQ